MDENIDKHGRLDDDIFDYAATKSGKVLLYYDGKLVKTLSGKNAQKFLGKIEGLDGKDAQLVMAKETGNFKRGNERDGKNKRQ